MSLVLLLHVHHVVSEVDLGVVFLDHLLVILRVLQLNVLVETAFRAVRLRTLRHRAAVVTHDLSGGTPVPLLLLVVDLEGHAQDLLVPGLVLLQEWLAFLTTYLESLELAVKVAFLVEQLLEAVGEYDVGVIETAVLLVEVVILLLGVTLAFRLGLVVVNLVLRFFFIVSCLFQIDHVCVLMIKSFI